MESSFTASSGAGANNHRQLPCKTFISVGTCPYRERCVYLHDPRVLCKSAKSKSRKKNKDDTAVDSLFWPFVSIHSNHAPSSQVYNVPAPQTDKPFVSYHDEAMYSLWNSFIECCMAINLATSVRESMSMQPSLIPYESENRSIFNEYEAVNKYTGRRRLNIFLELSNTIDPADNYVQQDGNLMEEMPDTGVSSSDNFNDSEVQNLYDDQSHCELGDGCEQTDWAFAAANSSGSIVNSAEFAIDASQYLSKGVNEKSFSSLQSITDDFRSHNHLEKYRRGFSPQTVTQSATGFENNHL